MQVARPAFNGPHSAAAAPSQHQFSPYADNGGTVVAVSADDFALIAADTRQTSGFNIETRYAPRCHQITESVAIGAAGFAGDCSAFIRRLKLRVETYQHNHQSSPDLSAVARLVQTMLYGKRFFPYYSWILLAGIDRDGTGAVYSYDPVGSYARYSCGVSGSASAVIEPFIDNQIMGKNMSETVRAATPGAPQIDDKGRAQIPLQRALGIVTDAFTGATERQIEAGDGLEIIVIKQVDADEDDSGMAVEGSAERKKKIEVDLVRRPLKRD